jgi:hypothetical protein
MSTLLWARELAGAASLLCVRPGAQGFGGSRSSMPDVLAAASRDGGLPESLGSGVMGRSSDIVCSLHRRALTGLEPMPVVGESLKMLTYAAAAGGGDWILRTKVLDHRSSH